jgi:predicted secreted hydrolase
MKPGLFIAIFLSGLISTSVLLLRDGSQPAPPNELSVQSILTDEGMGGFERAYSPRSFVFPADHGPHPRFKHEWWYYTGNLETEQGRRFGFQLTLFRNALAPKPPERASAWATEQIYMAHFALSDIQDGIFHSFERFSRASLGLAGAQVQPFKVWLEDWWTGSKGGGLLPLQLHATEGAIAIDLQLDSNKPIVLQGVQGFSRKSAEPGNASYYYSLTRLLTQGTIHIGDQTYHVKGLSWLDREWGTSALAPEQVGWDWFSLQLDDGRDLMYYQLRRQDGRADAMSSGTLVKADGSYRMLTNDEVELEVLSQWQSPRSGTTYPAHWRLRLPGEALDLEIIPLLADQEMHTSLRYWEGAVSVQGTKSGRGYVEMTGYPGQY